MRCAAVYYRPAWFPGDTILLVIWMRSYAQCSIDWRVRKRRTQTEKIALAGSGDFAFAGQETPHSHQPTLWSGILSPAAPYRNEARGGAPMAQHRAGSTARGLRMGINAILCRICREGD